MCISAVLTNVTLFSSAPKHGAEYLIEYEMKFPWNSNDLNIQNI